MNRISSKVSIVLPTYNGAKYIRQSIDSCLNQTYKNIELIIVNDGSTDGTPEIIRSYEDGRIKYLTHEKNKGLPHALNTGFTKATGEYLAWTSDDNFYAEEAIEVMVRALHTNERVDFVYADYYFIDENNNISRSMCNPQPNMLNRGNCIGPCFLYGKKVCEETGDYDPEFFLVEDYEYWLRVRKKFKMKKINDCLYYFRLHPLSLSLSTNTSLVKKQMEKVRRKHIYTSIRYRLRSLTILLLPQKIVKELRKTKRFLLR
ncbi:MAG TPA: glycosyltransferase [Candidatus Scalindua sp.]|nr:glycosyltransferase [Candidatus Scalindua sp.]